MRLEGSLPVASLVFEDDGKQADDHHQPPWTQTILICHHKSANPKYNWKSVSSTNYCSLLQLDSAQSYSVTLGHIVS